MTPAPGAGSEGTKKKRRRKRPAHRAPLTKDATTPGAAVPKEGAAKRPRPPAKSYAKRVDEVSAGGLVIDHSGKNGLLIGRIDHKDASGQRILWSLPKGHIEEGETPEQAALREVAEETGIESSIERALGVIDFWFMAGGKRIHMHWSEELPCSRLLLQCARHVQLAPYLYLHINECALKRPEHVLFCHHL